MRHRKHLPHDGNARKWRATARYRREREAFLTANPFCAHCRAEGVLAGATDLDHIEPVHLAPQKFWLPSNWQGLCRDHHKIKSMREQDAYFGKRRGHLEDAFAAEIAKQIGELK